MLLGITSRLPGWRLAITGAKLLWNQSWKSLGSKSANSGARAVKVRFKMVSRTPGFARKVMFLWKLKDSCFSSGRHLPYWHHFWNEASLVAHLHWSLVYQWHFFQEAHQKSSILSQILSIHLITDGCKSLEKLIESIIIMGLCQAFKHLPYDGLILRSRAVWI